MKVRLVWKNIIEPLRAYDSEIALDDIEFRPGKCGENIITDPGEKEFFDYFPTTLEPTTETLTPNPMDIREYNALALSNSWGSMMKCSIYSGNDTHDGITVQEDYLRKSYRNWSFVNRNFLKSNDWKLVIRSVRERFNMPPISTTKSMRTKTAKTDVANDIQYIIYLFICWFSVMIVSRLFVIIIIYLGSFWVPF